MKRESKHTSWIILLRRWFSGDATRRDEQALEAIAKDDPFVAEALEGYRSLPEDDHALDLARLKVRLRKRYGKKRRGVVFYAVRAAAAGAVLVAAWMGLQQFYQSEMDNRDMAEMSKKIAPPPAGTVFNPSELAIPGGEEAEDAMNGVAAVRQKEPPSEPEAQPSKVELLRPKDAAENETSHSTFAGPADSTAGGNAVPAAGMAMENDAAPPAERLAGNPQSTIAQAQNNDIRRVAGHVTDASGEPLTGVSVFDESSNRAAVTDVDGNFSMEVGDSAENLSLSYTGFENRKIELGPESFVEVKMEQSTDQLQEVAVTGRKARRSKKLDASASAAPAAPSPKDGFRKFKRYLRKNLRYPEAAVQNGVEGRVRLRFRVTSGGRPTDFEVLESLGAGCDAEAIRLLKKGPKWAPAGVAVYSVKFKL